MFLDLLVFLIRCKLRFFAPTSYFEWLVQNQACRHALFSVRERKNRTIEYAVQNSPYYEWLFWLIVKTGVEVNYDELTAFLLSHVPALRDIEPSKRFNKLLELQEKSSKYDNLIDMLQTHNYWPAVSPVVKTSNIPGASNLIENELTEFLRARYSERVVQCFALKVNTAKRVSWRTNTSDVA